jgi:hypothetical protein
LQPGDGETYIRNVFGVTKWWRIFGRYWLALCPWWKWRHGFRKEFGA